MNEQSVRFPAVTFLLLRLSCFRFPLCAFRVQVSENILIRYTNYAASVSCYNSMFKDIIYVNTNVLIFIYTVCTFRFTVKGIFFLFVVTCPSFHMPKKKILCILKCEKCWSTPVCRLYLRIHYYCRFYVNSHDIGTSEARKKRSWNITCWSSAT